MLVLHCAQLLHDFIPQGLKRKWCDIRFGEQPPFNFLMGETT